MKNQASSAPTLKEAEAYRARNESEFGPIVRFAMIAAVIVGLLFLAATMTGQ